MIHRDSLIQAIYLRSEYHSFILCCWDIHLSVHLLFHQIHTSVDILPWKSNHAKRLIPNDHCTGQGRPNDRSRSRQVLVCGRYSRHVTCAFPVISARAPGEVAVIDFGVNLIVIYKNKVIEHLITARCEFLVLFSYFSLPLYWKLQEITWANSWDFVGQMLPMVLIQLTG